MSSKRGFILLLITQSSSFKSLFSLEITRGLPHGLDMPAPSCGYCVHSADVCFLSKFMFNPSTHTATAAPDRELTKVWLSRYLPNLGLLPQATRQFFEERLAVVISEESRQETQKKLLRVIDTDCIMAAIQAQKLVAESGQVLQLGEARALSTQISRVYKSLLTLYVEDFVFSPVLDSLHDFETREAKMSALEKIVPAFDRLMHALRPLLVQLQSLYATSKNRRAIGFLTTQLHLSRQRILDRLDSYERLWLSPYLQLIEDFVCIPWQRVCVAATSAMPEQVAMAQQVLFRSDAIAGQVYQRALRTFPNHMSRQGRIQSAAVQQSSVRDLSMFQAYMWLCVLEGNLSSVQEELLPLCLLVFPCAQVKWDFVIQGIRWLIEEIKTELTPSQQQIFMLTAAPTEHLFVAANPEAANIETINHNLQLRFAL